MPPVSLFCGVVGLIAVSVAGTGALHVVGCPGCRRAVPSGGCRKEQSRRAQGKEFLLYVNCTVIEKNVVRRWNKVEQLEDGGCGWTRGLRT